MSSRKPKVFNTLRLDNPARGRFNLQLDDIDEEPTANNSLVGNVQERFPGFFDIPDRCQPYKFEVGCEAYSLEDGFPETLDLSAYYKDKGNKRQPQPGTSIFASEYKYLHGDLQAAEHSDPITLPSSLPQSSSIYDQIEEENQRRIKHMDKEEIQRSLQEIHERLDPTTIEFLKNRSKSKKQTPKVSLFKQRMKKTHSSDAGVNEAATTNKEPTDQTPKDADVKNEEFIRQLEVIPDKMLDNDDQLKEYSRLAIDPMHMDFTKKYMRSVVLSQERNLIRLFDKLQVPPKRYDNSDPLVDTARSRISQIRDLYLEELQVLKVILLNLHFSVTDQNQRERRFAKDVNPVVNSCWSLVPIRRVVDAQSVRGDSDVQDDREIVELALLWTLLLYREQPTYFLAIHSTPSDIYCRLAEIYMLGPDIFKSDLVQQCVGVLIREFLLPKAKDGHLSLRATKPISGLDAFLPFYEDLLNKFLEFSYGDVHFSVLLLMAAYMNTSLADSVTMQCLLWSRSRDVGRQIVVTVDDIKIILEHVRHNLADNTKILRQQFPDQFNALLKAYENATKTGTITQERNSGIFQLASEQLDMAAKSL